MQKRLLVLAAGILQVPVIKKAKEMGIYVIATDGDPNAVGLKYADKAVVVNITSEEEVLKVAREEQIDGVIHPCSEVSMNVMGRLNDELGLSGITREQAIRATNKHLMREAFEKGKIRDEEKKNLSKEHGIKLVYINFDEVITTELIKSRVEEN